MAGGIVRKHDVAGPETSHRAVAGLDLDLSGERNDILAPWRRVIIAPMGWRHATKDDPVHRLKLGNFHVSPEVEFNLKVFEMRFVVRSGVYSNDLHELGCRRIGGKKQGEKNSNLVPIVPAVPSRSKCWARIYDQESTMKAEQRVAFFLQCEGLCRGEENGL